MRGCASSHKGGEAVDAAHGDGGLDLLAVEGARAEARADEGLVAEHRGFGEGAAVVAGLGLPGVAADLGDAGDRLAAGGGRVLAPRRRADRGALARRDHRPRAVREDGGMAVEAVVGLVGADRGDRRVDGGEQALELGAVVGLARGQGVGDAARRSGCPRARCSLRQTRRLSLPCTRTFHSPSPWTLSPVASMARCSGPPPAAARASAR